MPANPTTPVAQATHAKLKVLFADTLLRDRIEYLAARWQDEHEYENIAEYGEALKDMLAKHGAAVVRMSRRPFGVVFSLPDVPVHYLYYVKAGNVGIRSAS